MKFDGYYEPIQIENPEIIQCAEGKTNPYAGEEGQLSKSRGFYCPFTFENPEEQARIDQEVAEARQQKDRKTGVEVMKCEALDIVNHGNQIVYETELEPESVIYIPERDPSPLLAYSDNRSLTFQDINLFVRPPVEVQDYFPMPAPETNIIPSSQESTRPLREAILSGSDPAEQRKQPANNEYTMMNKAAASVPFAVWNYKVYLYDKNCYKLQSAEDVAGVILDLCREDVIQIGKYSTVRNACELLKIDTRFHTPQEWLDMSSRYLSFLNGNLNLDDGRLHPHSAGVFTTYAIQANYLGTNCQTETPVFDRVLQRISGGDTNLELRIWQMVGYCLTPDIQGKCGFLLQGVTNSGKSLLSNYLGGFFPEENVAAISLHSIGDRFATAELDGATLCITPDLPAKPLPDRASGMIKALSGNDLIQADRKYMSYTKFRFMGKLVMSTNHALQTKSYDPAFVGRIVVIPFRYSIPKTEWNPHLLEQLNGERDAVASKAMEAYFQLRDNGYVFAGDYHINDPSVLAQDTHGNTQILVYQFLQRHYEAAPNEIVYIMDAYEEFCVEYGVQCSVAVFGRYFGEVANQSFGAHQDRKRRSAAGNPISCIVGIRSKEC